MSLLQLYTTDHSKPSDLNISFIVKAPWGGRELADGGPRSGLDIPVSHSLEPAAWLGCVHADNRRTTEQVQLQKNISSFGLCPRLRF